MPSSFGQYTSGIEPVRGIAEAGGRAAEMQLRGWENLGNSLAQGIKAYSDAKNEREMLAGEIEAYAGQTKQLLDLAAQSREHKAFVDTYGGDLVATLDSMKNAPDMSLGKLRGVANKAKLDFSNFGAKFQMFNAMKDVKEKSMVQQGLAAVGTTQETTQKAYNFGKESINSAEPLQIQRGRALELQAKLAEEKGVDFDVSTALKAWDAGARERLTELQRTGNPTATVMLEQLDALAQKRAGEEYRANLGDSKETTDETKFNLGRGTELSKVYAPSAEELMKVRGVATEEKIKSEALVPRELKSANVSPEMISAYTKVVGAKEAEIKNNLDRQITEQFNAKSAPIEQELNNVERLLAEAKKPTYTKGVPNPSVPSVMSYEEVKKPEEMLAQDAARVVELERQKARALGAKQALKEDFTNIKATVEKTRVKEEAIKQGIEPPKEVPTATTAPTAPAITAEGQPAEPVQPARPAPPKLSVALPRREIGTYQKVEALSDETIKARTRDWVTQNHGITQTITNPDGTTRTIKIAPANFDNIYRNLKQTPETYTDASGFTYLRGLDGGWSKIADPAKQVDRTTQNKAMEATFGNVPTNEQEFEVAKVYGGLIPEEVQTLDFVNPKNAGGTTGSGTYLVGSYRGKNYDEFRKNTLGLIQARTGIEELKRISEKSGEALSFEDTSRANKIQTYIMADMKSDIVGNQVTEEEWKRLEKYIADPTKIFTIEGAERRGYDVVLSKLNSAIANLATGSGVKVIQTQNVSKTVEGITSQFKIAEAQNRGQR